MHFNHGYTSSSDHRISEILQYAFANIKGSFTLQFEEEWSENLRLSNRSTHYYYRDMQKDVSLSSNNQGESFIEWLKNKVEHLSIKDNDSFMLNSLFMETFNMVKDRSGTRNCKLKVVQNSNSE